MKNHLFTLALFIAAPASLAAVAPGPAREPLSLIELRVKVRGGEGRTAQPADNGDRFRYLLDLYNNARAGRDRLDYLMLEYGVPAGVFAIDSAAGAAATTGVPGILLKASAKSASSWLGSAIDGVKSELQSDAEKDLMARYRQLQEPLRQQLQSQLQPGAGADPGTAYQLLYGHRSDDPAAAPDLVHLDPLARTLIINERLNLLRDLTSERIFSLEVKYGEVSLEVTSLTKNVRGLATALASVKSATDEHFREIVENQQDIAEGLAALNAKTDKTNQDIEFLQTFMFGHLTPAEQLKALQGGFFPDMPAQERRDLHAKVELVEKQQRVMAAVNTFLADANIVVGIVDKLNLPPQLKKTLSTAQNIGNAACSTAASLMSGNYLAAAGAVFSLIGGGPDVGQMRHEQLVSMLENVQGDIEELKRGQAEILRVQRETYELLLTVAESVQKGFAETQKALDNLRGDILVNQILIDELRRQDSDACERFLDLRKNAGQYPSFIRGKFRRSSDLFTYLTDQHDLFKRCWAGLEAGLHVSGKPNRMPWFLRTDIANSSRKNDLGKIQGQVAALENQVLAPLLAILDEGLKKDGLDLGRTIEALATPARTLPELERKKPLVGLLDPAFSQRARLTPEQYHGLLSGLVSISKLTYFTDFGLKIHPYARLVKDFETATFCTAEELARGDCRDLGRSRWLLERSLELTKIALAQQALLDGDLALPYLGEKILADIHAAGPGSPEARQADQLLLQGNSRLAFNFLLWLMRRGFTAQAGASAVLAYREAYFEQSDQAFRYTLAGLMGDYFKVQAGKAGGWQIELQLGEKSTPILLPLPTPEQFAEQRLLLSTSTRQLLRLKKQLDEEILSYEFPRSLNAEDYHLLQNAYALALQPQPD